MATNIEIAPGRKAAMYPPRRTQRIIGANQRRAEIAIASLFLATAPPASPPRSSWIRS